MLKPDDFKFVFEAGSREHSQLLTAVVRKRDGEDARLGMAIARKAIPTAVARNRLKRKLREIFRERRAEFAAVDIIILAKAAARTASPAQLDGDIIRLWKRIHHRWPRS